MKVLLAGGNGFIGQHICEVLAGNVDFDVIDLKTGNDISDAVLEPGEYDAIILLAADLGRNLPMYRNNLRIYNWLANQRGMHVVYASSAAVYRDNASSEETDAPAPPTLYGESKLLGETIIKATQPSHTILRLANVYGDGEGNGAIDAFKRGNSTIFGDGSDIRDYVSVKTVAQAFAKAATNPDKFKGETYNISTGVPTTTLEAFRKFGSGEPVYVEPRDFDTRYSLLINHKAKAAGLVP